MHIYGTGGHGGSITPRKGIPFGEWPQRFVEWAVDAKLMPAPPAASAGQSAGAAAK
jgi:hypothetical protein